MTIDNMAQVRLRPLWASLKIPPPIHVGQVKKVAGRARKNYITQNQCTID